MVEVGYNHEDYCTVNCIQDLVNSVVFRVHDAACGFSHRQICFAQIFAETGKAAKKWAPLHPSRSSSSAMKKSKNGRQRKRFKHLVSRKDKLSSQMSRSSKLSISSKFSSSTSKWPRLQERKMHRRDGTRARWFWELFCSPKISSRRWDAKFRDSSVEVNRSSTKRYEQVLDYRINRLVDYSSECYGKAAKDIAKWAKRLQI